MGLILYIKFSDPILLQKLENVTEPIVEDTVWGDKYWGKYKGQGENMLGQILTVIKESHNDLNTILAFVGGKAKC